MQLFDPGRITGIRRIVDIEPGHAVEANDDIIFLRLDFPGDKPDKVPVSEILNDGLVKGMSVVGEKFKNNEFYVPEVLIAARAMHSGMELLKPLLADSGVEPVGKVAIGTVKGDLHDIGKNLVAMSFRGQGYNVIDIGVDQSPESFVNATKENNADLIGLSALLTTTMPQMKAVVDGVKDAGLDTPVVIGGAPVTQDYADEIGAQGYGPDAATAVEVGAKLLGI